MSEQQPESTVGENANDPFNDVERAIVDGAEGKLGNNDVLAKIVASSLFFLTSEEVTDNSKVVQPLVLQGPDEKPVLAIFTHPARVAQPFLETAPYAVSINGGEALRQADGLGLAINPGHPIGLVLDAENVKALQTLLKEN